MSWPAKSCCCLMLLLLAGVPGCKTAMPAGSGDATSRQRLMADVRFLCQPELNGRKPRTWGSHLARQFIEREFKADGLIPWEGATSFALPFGYGRNIVGVLPGTEPDAGIVLVSAHYDHIGKDNKGKICPGAADNAAGVAALLECARQLSLAPGHRLKGTVAFAAFDCEESMLLGSFAFAGRADVQAAKIRAVVNVDILGRDFLQVMVRLSILSSMRALKGCGYEPEASPYQSGKVTFLVALSETLRKVGELRLWSKLLMIKT